MPMLEIMKKSKTRRTVINLLVLLLPITVFVGCSNSNSSSVSNNVLMPGEVTVLPPTAPPFCNSLNSPGDMAGFCLLNWGQFRAHVFSTSNTACNNFQNYTSSSQAANGVMFPSSAFGASGLENMQLLWNSVP
jgi:hypothetical protein